MNNQNNTSIDQRLTRLLQENGREPNTEIAKKLGISEATVRNRLQKLIKDECIKIVAIVNPLKITSGFMGNLRIKVDNDKIQHVAKKLITIEELWYVAQLSGPADFDIEFYVPSQGQFAQLIDTVNGIEGVTSVETSIVVRYLKNNWGFGVPGKAEAGK